MVAMLDPGSLGDVLDSFSLQLDQECPQNRLLVKCGKLVNCVLYQQVNLDADQQPAPAIQVNWIFFSFKKAANA
jgi:hypothetical protein